MAQKIISFTVQANQGVQATGVHCNNNLRVTCDFDSGTWTQNPATGMHDWSGDGAHAQAAGEFALPGAPEGCLVYYVGGAATKFPAATVVMPNNGAEVQFVINDDLKGVHGAGLADNQGALVLKFTIDDI